MNTIRCLILLGCLCLSACGQADTVADSPPTATALSERYPVPENLSPSHAPSAPLPIQQSDDTALPAHTAVVGPSPTPQPTALTVTQEPLGPRLRELWPHLTAATQRRAMDSRPTSLMFIEQTADRVSGRRASIFWQLDLQQPQQRYEVFRRDESGWQVYHAGLSHDGQWLGYLSQRSDGEMSALHVARRDGTQDSEVAMRVGHAYDSCRRSFAWAPSSPHLVYIAFHDQPEKANSVFYDFYLYDPTQSTPPVLLSRETRALLIGWQDDSHVLVVTSEQEEPPHILISLDVLTGTRTVLQEVPSPGCVGFVANRTHILFDQETSNSIFDIQTKQMMTFIGNPNQWVWPEQAQSFVEFPLQAEERAQMVNAQGRTPLTLMPPYKPGTTVRLEGAAPDASSIAVCMSDDTRHDQNRSQLWLYDTVADQWTQLLATNSCPNIVGWFSQP